VADFGLLEGWDEPRFIFFDMRGNAVAESAPSSVTCEATSVRSPQGSRTGAVLLNTGRMTLPVTVTEF
jgi:hypothetical protein